MSVTRRRGRRSAPRSPPLPARTLHLGARRGRRSPALGGRPARRAIAAGRSGPRGRGRARGRADGRAARRAGRSRPTPTAQPALRARLRRGRVDARWSSRTGTRPLHERLAETGLAGLIDGGGRVGRAGRGEARHARSSRRAAGARRRVRPPMRGHVGDSVEADVRRARFAAGIRPVLICRAGEPPALDDVPVIRRLDALPQLVGARRSLGFGGRMSSFKPPLRRPAAVAACRVPSCPPGCHAPNRPSRRSRTTGPGRGGSRSGARSRSRSRRSSLASIAYAVIAGVAGLSADEANDVPGPVLGATFVQDAPAGRRRGAARRARGAGRRRRGARPAPHARLWPAVGWAAAVLATFWVASGLLVAIFRRAAEAGHHRGDQVGGWRAPRSPGLRRQSRA